MQHPQDFFTVEVSVQTQRDRRPCELQVLNDAVFPKTGDELTEVVSELVNTWGHELAAIRVVHVSFDMPASDVTDETMRQFVSDHLNADGAYYPIFDQYGGPDVQAEHDGWARHYAAEERYYRDVAGR